jgi:hypothetical protein
MEMPSRGIHKKELEESRSGPMPTAGKKGGELPKTGHGPSTEEKRETGGKSKPKQKPD